jgi:hypothetical protein
MCVRETVSSLYLFELICPSKQEKQNNETQQNGNPNGEKHEYAPHQE